MSFQLRLLKSIQCLCFCSAAQEERDGGEKKLPDSPVQKLIVKFTFPHVRSNVTKNGDGDGDKSGVSSSDTTAHSDSDTVAETTQPRRSKRLLKKQIASQKIKQQLRDMKKKRIAKNYFIKESTEMYVNATGKTISMKKLRGRSKKIKEELR